MSQKPSSHVFFVHLLFFLSGFSALIYELLWLRQLGLIFGNSVYATATVLTAYMAGLGFGAWWFGRKAESCGNPVRLFGILVCATGLYALLVPLLFHLLSMTHILAYRSISSSALFLIPLRFALAVGIMIVPTALMGGTLPVLVRGLPRTRQGFGSSLGLLYGLNTLGAVAGLLASGFFLIPAMGLRSTNLLAVACNVAIGLAAFGLAGRLPPPEEILPEAQAHDRRETLFPTARISLLATALSGFLALALEVVWFRTLVLVFGSTTYSFCAMLSVFLLGLAAGSLVFSRLIDRTRRPMLLFCLCLLCIGGYTLWSMTRFDAQPLFLLKHLMRHGFSWSAMISAKFMITLFFLLVPTLLFGFMFPLAARMARGERHESAGVVGRVYACNTMGSILGSLAAGFVLLRFLGIAGSLMLLAGLSLACGAALMFLMRERHLLRAAVWIPALVLAGLFSAFPPKLDPKLLIAGPYFTPWKYVQDGEIVLDKILASQKILLFEEGLLATIAVTKTEAQELFYISDGKVEADSSPRSVMLQRMMGHLPMLFHPDPKRVMNIGLGAGMSFGALGCYPVDALDVVEIEPASVLAADQWSDYNHSILRHPKTRIIIDDGRNYLLCTTSRYDVISSDPFEPVHSGANNLYTVDHFAVAKSRLNPGGIMCQYLPLYELSMEDFRTIIRSFVSVFPESTFFYTGDDTILLGFRDRIRHAPEDVRAKLSIPEVQASLREIGMNRLESILGMFVADMTDLKDMLSAGPLNTDDRPIVEYSAPKSALHYTPDINMQVLLEMLTPLPDSLVASLNTEARAAVDREREALQCILQANRLSSAGRVQEGAALLQKAYELAPLNPVVRNDLVLMHTGFGQSLLGAGRAGPAAEHFQQALMIQPNDFWALYHMVHLAMQAGQPQFAQNLIHHALGQYPESDVFYALNGKYEFTAGNAARAGLSYEKALSLAPEKAEYWEDYAAVAQAAGNVKLADEAREHAARLRKAR